MKTSSIGISSWTALVVAILAWCGVGYLLMFVLQMQSERADYVSNAVAANLQEGQAAQLRVLARETDADRATLLAAANEDVLSAVNMIEAVSASGTPVHVTSAQPVKASAKASAQQMNIVDLTVHTEGTFNSVMHIVQMLETLPLTTSVQEVNLGRPPIDLNAKSSPNTWTASVRLRFYTTAPLST